MSVSPLIASHCSINQDDCMKAQRKVLSSCYERLEKSSIKLLFIQRSPISCLGRADKWRRVHLNQCEFASGAFAGKQNVAGFAFSLADSHQGNVVYSFG